MNVIHRQTASILFTVVAFTFLLALIYQARRPLIAFMFAIVFAYLLDPLVTHIQSLLHTSRSLAIALTYLLLGIAIAAFGITAGPRIVSQAERLGRELPALMENVGSGHIAEQFGSQRGWDYQTQLQVQQFLIEHRDGFAQYAQTIVSWAAELAGNLIWVLLIPVLAVFLLKDSSSLADAFVELIASRSQRRFLKSLLHDLDAMLAKFISTQLLFSAIAFTAYTSFLLLARFPYAFALGAIGGLLELIPFVGPMVTMVLILGMAVLTGYAHWPIVLVFLILWRGVEDYVISPYLMSRGLKFHPLAVIAGVLIGGEVAGVIGLFLSVPIIAGLRIVWNAWDIQRKRNEVRAKVSRS